MRKERDKRVENLFKKKIRPENVPSLGKEIDIHIQEAQSPKQDEPKKIYTKTHNLKCQKLRIKRDS